MDYRELRPPPELAPWVECAWTLDAGEPFEHRVLPDGCIDVLWSESESVHVVGTMTRALVVPLGATARLTGTASIPAPRPHA